jgi:hypothetical protein
MTRRIFFPALYRSAERGKATLRERGEAKGVEA